MTAQMKDTARHHSGNNANRVPRQWFRAVERDTKDLVPDAWVRL